MKQKVDFSTGIQRLCPGCGKMFKWYFDLDFHPQSQNMFTGVWEPTRQIQCYVIQYHTKCIIGIKGIKK